MIVGRYKILYSLLAILLFCVTAQAQTSSPLSKFKLIDKKTIKLDTVLSEKKYKIQDKPLYQKRYHQSLGVMCRLENRLNKSAKRPIKIRLGTVQYTEKLEYGN